MRDYVVIGKFSKVNFEQIIKRKENAFAIDKKKLKLIIATTLSAIIFTTLTDVSFAASLDANPIKHELTQLKHILDYIDWLIDLLRLIVSSVAGLIMTFAGYKWATTIDGSGAETAKKIMKNAFIGALLVFIGATIANFFVSKMEQILVG